MALTVMPVPRYSFSRATHEPHDRMACHCEPQRDVQTGVAAGSRNEDLQWRLLEQGRLIRDPKAPCLVGRFSELHRATAWCAFVALAGALAVTNLLSGERAVAATAKPITLPVMLSLTGSAALLGAQEQQVFAIAEKFLSDHGKPVHFVYYDDTSSPQVAVQLMNQLLSGGARVVLGPTLRATCAPLEPIVKSGPVNYCLSPAIRPDAGTFVFSAGTDTWDLDRIALRYAKARGWRRIALLATTDASGTDAVKAYGELLAEPEFRELTMVANLPFSPSAISVAAELSRIKAANPDALLAWASGAPVTTIFRGMRDVGLNVPVMTGYSNMTYTQMQDAASVLPDQLYFPVPSALGSRRPRGLNLDRKVETALREFESAYASTGHSPDGGDMGVWDPIMLVMSALGRSGSDASSAQIREYLTSIKTFAGINGIYNFEKYPQRGLGSENSLVTEWSPSLKTWTVVSRAGGLPLR